MNKLITCYKCSLPYIDFPGDLNIQNDLWEMINPSPHKGGGLLCPNCICKELIALGMTCVSVIVDVTELCNDQNME